MSKQLSTTKVTCFIMWFANVVCKVWAIGRSFSRDKSDFDYFIFDLRKQYPTELSYNTAMRDLGFFSKVVEEDNSVVKTSSIKIGDCNLRYSITRLKRMSPSLDIPTLVHNEYLHRNEDYNSIQNLIIQTQIHHNKPHNLKVLSFKGKGDSDATQKNN